MSFVFISLILGALAAIYFYLTRNYTYWQKRGIPCPDGALPGVGHMLPVISMKMSFVNYYRKLYNDNKGRSMVGFYNFTTPSLVVLEPELVKAVLQTNFASFAKNTFTIDPEVDPLLAHHPFFNVGDKWLSGRKKLSYAFSNVRLKVLLESVKSTCRTLENFVDEKLNKTEKVEMELRDLCTRYTAQVVAAAAFGIDGYCFDDKHADKSFKNICSAVLEPTLQKRILTILTFLVPRLKKFLKMAFVPRYIDRFIRKLVAEFLEQRRADEIPRNDFLHLMVELENSQGDKFDLNAVAAQAFSFVIDGYGTSSTVMSFVCHNLATHPEVQEKLREEVMSVLNKYDGTITYEGLKEMTYMDQVLNESQRMVHVLGFMHKICTEETELKGSDGLVCRVPSGADVVIPVQALQGDSRYWENPEVFDPERFSPDKKHTIDRFTFLPFSEGPRMCAGLRMAVVQIKAGLTALLRKYRLALSPKTKIPLKMKIGSTLAIPESGLWVFVEKL